MGEPGLPDRARPVQVLLGVGAVLVVSAAAAAAGGPGGAARLPLLLLAVVAAALSAVAALHGLGSTAETLAACAAGPAVVACALGGTLRAGSAIPLATVAAGCLVLHRVAPSTAGWPLGAWAAAQVAVLRGVDVVPGRAHPALFLAVALAGLAVALGGRPLVARVALVTTVPWWGAGGLGALTTAWSGSGAERQLAALLVVAAAAGLLAARLRAVLDPLTGPPIAVPLLAGAVAGLGVAGALAGLGTAGLTTAGYLGVLAATTVPDVLSGWRRGLFRPVALAAGSVMAGTALAGLWVRRDWGALIVLFLLTAGPAVLIAWRRPAERPSALPWAVGCLVAAALCAVPAGRLDPLPAAVVLTALYGLGLAAACALPDRQRTPTAAAAAAAAIAALVLGALQGERDPLALLLGIQGLLTIEWAVRTTVPVAARPPWAAWRLGAAASTAAVWLAVSAGEVHVLEEYTLPLAVGLLLAQGPRLVEGPSWPAWGPGLLVAAVPSAVMAVVLPGGTRPLALLSAAAVAMVLGAATGVRAPLEIAAATAVGTAVALALATVLWPVAAALAIGAVLLAVGARRERLPVGFFGSRLADLR